MIAGITPWNFPILTPMRKIAPALVFGDAIILKPSEVAPAAACIVADAGRATLPAGLLQIVNGGADVGQSLVDLPVVSGVTFTGSVAVGRAIYASAAARLAKVSLELGGKNAAIMHDAANLDTALDHISGAAFLCSGQRCTAISRVLVHRPLAEKVIDGLVRRARSLVPGDGTNPSTTLGPLVSARQYDRVAMLVTRALNEGLPRRDRRQPGKRSRARRQLLFRTNDSGRRAARLRCCSRGDFRTCDRRDSVRHD